MCALLAGGGYAEKVAVPAGQVLPVPSGVSLKDAAAFPEVACTVWSTVFMMSRLSAGETFLVTHGATLPLSCSICLLISPMIEFLYLCPFSYCSCSLLQAVLEVKSLEV